jgi:CHAT domain-containing protein
LELREGNWRSRHERVLEGEPLTYFSGLITEIEWLDAREPTVREGNEERLISIGTRLADLLSEPIRARLALRAWNPDEEHSARTLLILSDDPWIPWEILFLPGVGRQGRFLGEAFALTVWTWDLPGCAALPLKRIGTVFAPTSSSDLKAAAAEHDDLEALARGSVRRVERITPHLVPVLTALRSGSFSGLHFSGHGAVRGEHPDLWGLPLENLEHLRAIDLATCDLSETRPLVFLNACRTGQSGVSLTGLVGSPGRSSMPAPER